MDVQLLSDEIKIVNECAAKFLEISSSCHDRKERTVLRSIAAALRSAARCADSTVRFDEMKQTHKELRSLPTIRALMHKKPHGTSH